MANLEKLKIGSFQVFYVFDMELNLSGELEKQQVSSQHSPKKTGIKRGMILPFLPLSMSFDNVNYYVDMPKVCF